MFKARKPDLLVKANEKCKKWKCQKTQDRFHNVAHQEAVQEAGKSHRAMEEFENSFVCNFVQQKTTCKKTQDMPHNLARQETAQEVHKSHRATEEFENSTACNFVHEKSKMLKNTRHAA